MSNQDKINRFHATQAENDRILKEFSVMCAKYQTSKTALDTRRRDHANKIKAKLNKRKSNAA